ncbi:MAG: chromosome segregation protein SMC [Halanaerobiales bacterium]
MFLKKIKIHGFKSFAKPIVIDFPSPLTAIVGPNGSGKSNVVDAIRWAMGEQSAKSLRGSRMSDIIFAGSADFKPLHKASVTLYFDNSNNALSIDKNQIRIKRTVTEDGQSDYYLNGESCRLKDIDELLMDTGLGKDSYSIVGQGKIDSILNSKPEKLRELFEEAAGIVKHKTRKEEAERRLDRTRQDLQRIKDLVWELDKQVKPLRKSSEKARKYLRLREELKELEVNLLLDRWENNHQVLDEIRYDEEILRKKVENLEIELSEADSILQQKLEELEIEESSLEELQENLYQTKIKREQAENNLKVLAERNNGLKREQRNYNNQLDSLKRDCHTLEKKKIELKKNLETIKDSEKEIKDKTESVKEELNCTRGLIEDKKEELLNRRNSILNENMEFNEIQSGLEKSREKARYLEHEIDKMADKRKGFSEQLEELILQEKALRNEKDKIEASLISANNELISYKKKQKKSEDTIEKIKSKAEKIKNQINHTNSRLKVLQDMEEDYQGYFRGVKNILKEEDNIPGVIGVIADLIDVDKKYELAVETALGAKLQNIVTKDDSVARKAVKYLKSINGGRATFLPLNMVRGNKARVERPGIKNMPGYLGIASDLINYDEELDQVMLSLLGKIIVAEDLDKATEISKNIKSSIKIVTLDGGFINTTGAITGGSQRNNTRGLLGRSREIEELKEKAGEMDKLYSTEKNKIEGLQNEKSELIKLQEEKAKQIKELEFEKINLDKDIMNTQREENRLETDLKLIDKDFEDYHKQLGNNDNLIQRLEDKLAALNSEQNKEKNQINNKELEIQHLEKKEEELNKRLTECRVEWATVTEKKNSIHSEKNNLESEIKNLNIREDDIKKALEDLTGKLYRIEERRKELLDMKKDFAKQIEEMEDAYKKMQKAYKEKEKDVKGIQSKYNKRQQELGSIKDEHHKYDLKITRLEDKNIQIAERLREEYEVSPEKGIEERIAISNYAQVSHKIKEFKDAIKHLGAVNIGAIDEYEELTERLEYLREQQDDLLQARASIEKVIEELERNMTELFYQTFAEVKDQFENTFEQLFNGGKAELRLTKPEDLLETGVEVEAQPPGKQLKKLSLMSGGERALTAIALVFAFLKVNPSPMYILDEIDAPLDDANVKRFANYLKEYSEFVQFLVITHNKLMMTEANVIYGITMEEKGVSKLVSLKLDEEIA